MDDSMSGTEVILFTSPKAGSGAAREQIPRLEALLRAASIAYQRISDPKRLRSLCDQSRERQQPQPIVVAAGGDGTLSLIATHSDADTPLVPMPMGTENLLARHIKQTNDADAVFQTIRGGKPHQMDAGLANGRLFLIMATAGFDAEVVRRVHLKRKGHISRLSYFRPILQTLAKYRFPELHVSRFDESGNRIDHQTAGWAMAFNLPCYAGGLQIEPNAVGNDQLLDLITFAGRSVISGCRYVAGIALGRHRKFSDVRQERAPRMRFESKGRVAYELDGDYAGHLPLEICTLPGRIRLLLPPDDSPK